jgi:cytochrome c553
MAAGQAALLQAASHCLRCGFMRCIIKDGSDHRAINNHPIPMEIRRGRLDTLRVESSGFGKTGNIWSPSRCVEARTRSSAGQFRINYPATMKNLFAFLALAGIAQFAAAADTTGNTKSAANKVENCIGCHGIPGYKASFPEVYQVPMLGGQSAKYIENALNAYKKGERKHPTMRGIAAALSDQDIADVAAYYSQQK